LKSYWSLEPNLKSQRKTKLDAQKVTSKTPTTKMRQLSHIHFIEHLMYVTKKPRVKHEEKEGNSSLECDDSRTRSASTDKQIE
jgi:hypothetical protein